MIGGNQVPIGIEDGSIPNRAITASSKWDNNHGPSRARLNTVRQGAKTGAWSAKHNNRAQWIQVYLGRRPTTITQILTQGRQDYNQWVKTYTVSYSNNGRRFTLYRVRGRVRVRFTVTLYLNCTIPEFRRAIIATVKGSFSQLSVIMRKNLYI